jgi:hypothetical protein
VVWPSTALGRTAPSVLCIVALSRSVSVPVCAWPLRVRSFVPLCRLQSDRGHKYIPQRATEREGTCDALPVRWLRVSACVRFCGVVAGSSEFADFRRRVACVGQWASHLLNWSVRRTHNHRHAYEAHTRKERRDEVTSCDGCSSSARLCMLCLLHSCSSLLCPCQSSACSHLTSFPPSCRPLRLPSRRLPSCTTGTSGGRMGCVCSNCVRRSEDGLPSRNQAGGADSCAPKAGISCFLDRLMLHMFCSSTACMGICQLSAYAKHASPAGLSAPAWPCPLIFFAV